MKTISEVLNIAKQFHTCWGGELEHMCYAIDRAKYCRTISADESIEAQKHIMRNILSMEYLTLKGKLCKYFLRTPTDAEIKSFWEDHIEALQREEQPSKWYETEEGQEWLSNQPDIEQQFQLSKEHVISIGQRYICEFGDEYILAQTEPFRVALIALHSGNRYVDAVRVHSPINISEEEWEQITENNSLFILKTA